MGLFQSLKQSHAAVKVRQVLPFLSRVQTVLDFGCGDTSFAKALAHAGKKIQVTGLDVVDFKLRDDLVRVRVYDGKKIPYPNRHFDAVISYHVLHHTDAPYRLLSECLRVSKGTMILVEPVYRYRAEIIGMSLMDWLFNIWKDRSISMTYAYQTLDQWTAALHREGWVVTHVQDVELLPRWLPVGRSYMFVCKNKNPRRKKR